MMWCDVNRGLEKKRKGGVKERERERKEWKILKLIINKQFCWDSEKQNKLKHSFVKFVKFENLVATCEIILVKTRQINKICYAVIKI